MSNSVVEIGAESFQGCVALELISLPNSLMNMGGNIFRNCTSLTEIVIPNSVSSIGMHSFQGCTRMESISIPNSVVNWEMEVFEGCSSLREIVIPNSISEIPYRMFCNCSSLTDVSLPSSITNIGFGAFANCTSLPKITLPNSLESIAGSAFFMCTNLKNVICYAENVPSTATDIFNSTPIQEATLRVPASSVNLYRNAEPWKYFYKIVSIDGDTPDPQTCATPTISYTNGKLSFSCDTDDVQFAYEITDADIKKGNDAEIQLYATYNITVYAYKEGYYNSEVATTTLCWIDVEPKTEGLSNDIASVRGQAVMVQNQNGIITISGVNDEAVVSIYDLSGALLGSAKANGGQSTIVTNLRKGEVGIIRIGGTSLKVMMH